MKLLRLAVDAAPSPMILVDQQGRLAMVNRMAEELFGYDRAELVGAEVECLIPEGFRRDHPAHLREF